MKKFLKIAIGAVASLLVIGIVGAMSFYFVRGNIKKIELPADFSKGIAVADASRDATTDARIMSANLLVHYESWGGTPAKPRAKMFWSMIDKYKPDVVGLQEVSDEWFSCLQQNKGDYRIISPLDTGIKIKMTALMYNSATVELVEQGKLTYSQGDNPRLRRVVWGLFKNKSDGKRYIATSTHFDLVREGKEDAQLAIMESQADELFKLVSELSQKYDCPVFATGDYNAMENGNQNGVFDAPSIYEKLAGQLKDTKYIAEKQSCGDAFPLETAVYDHIFLKGNATVNQYKLLSESYMLPVSDHFFIFSDVLI